ncbi:hypothetical protein ACIBCD_33130 [Nocardia brasiliensis]|uniref:hypothetical protein n=1 Tax=Nocardia brasiliensis TaxID=37326 RepID=UPI00378A7DD9
MANLLARRYAAPDHNGNGTHQSVTAAASSATTVLDDADGYVALDIRLVADSSVGRRVPSARR